MVFKDGIYGIYIYGTADTASDNTKNNVQREK